MAGRQLRIALTAALAAVLLSAGCRPPAQPKASKTEPAHVDEGELNTVTLTEQAERRLGIQLAETTFTEMRRKRTVGGEVIVPPGQTIIVSAPIAGTLSPPAGGAIPAPGSQVAAGQSIFAFVPLLSAERDVLTPAERVAVAQTKANVAAAQVDAQRQIESAKVTVEAAGIAYDRAVQLLKNKAGSQRNVDEAAATLKLAQEALTTAEARHQLLSGITLDEQAGESAVRDIASPAAGVLRSLDAAAGETVGAGEALFSVVTLDRVWIRVPIYVGQWRDVDTGQPAMISEFGRPVGTTARAAQYVSAPPTANPLATTVDMYYELDNADGRLLPGQKLAVTVGLQSRAKSLVVPFKAILYDIHGGAWVYRQTGEHVYARQRVAVEYTDGGDAILASGPPPGTRVVTDGAAELFGTEFGVGH